MEKNKFRSVTVFILVSGLLVWLDAWTKGIAVQVLAGGREIILLPKVLSFLYVENRGAAFGILHGQKWFFAIITIVVLVGILYVILRLPMEKRYRPLYFVSMLIFSGAIGNFIDRMMQSYVVDFIYFKLIDFPVFNVADIYVTVGCFMMVLLFLLYYKDEEFAFLSRKAGQGSVNAALNEDSTQHEEVKTSEEAAETGR